MDTPLDNAKALYLTAIRDGSYEAAINEYSGARYTQHSTPVRDGRAGFIEFFEGFVKRNPIRDIQIVRAFQDGQHVFLHVLQDLNNGEFQYVTADIFDTDQDGLLIEHWDIIEEVGGPTPDGHTQLDGPTEASNDPTQIAQTDANKALVKRFIDGALTPADYGRFSDFVSEDCVQHQPGLGDGRHAWETAARNSGLRCVELHLVIGNADLVATLSEVEANETRLAVIDLYRIEGSHIVEHWNVTEEVTPESTWVNSGKF